MTSSNTLRADTLQPNIIILYSEIHEVDLWQVYHLSRLRGLESVRFKIFTKRCIHFGTGDSPCPHYGFIWVTRFGQFSESSFMIA